jgi:hypothetical protein
MQIMTVLVFVAVVLAGRLFFFKVGCPHYEEEQIESPV